MLKRKKPTEGKIISKSEDKIWHEWYDKLTPQDHDKMLKQLGLDEEDREEFKEELEEEIKEIKKPKKK